MRASDKALRDRLCAWLRANGLDPGVIPEGATIDVTPDHITVDVLEFSTGGQVKVDGSGRAFRRRHTVPHVVPPEQFG